MISPVLKNASYLTASRILNRGLFAFVSIALSRKLGVEGLGVYGFIFAFVSIIFLFTTIGNLVVVREIARDKKRSGEYAWNIFFLKVLLLGFAFFILSLATKFYPMTHEVKHLIYLCGFIFVVGCFSNFPNILFIAHQKFKFSVISDLIRDCTTVSLSLLFLFSGKGLLWVLYAYLIGYLVEFFYSFSIFFKHFWKFEVYRIKFFLWWRWLKQGVYFLLQSSLELISYNLNILIISFFIGFYYVGVYNASAKIIGAVYLVYGGFQTVVYPHYSSFTVKDKLKKVHNTYNRYSFVLAVIIFLALILLSKFIIISIYGVKFSESVAILKIMSFGVILALVNRNNSTFLNAMKKEKINFYFLAISYSTSMLLSILLVVPYGVKGVAFAGIVSSLVYVVISSLYIKRTQHNATNLHAKVAIQKYKKRA